MSSVTRALIKHPHPPCKAVFLNNGNQREAPWSSGERHGLTIQAMVLGRGFESRLHLKTRWKDGPLDGRKIMKDNKDSQMGQVTPKNI